LIREIDRSLMANGMAHGEVIVLACLSPVSVGGSAHWLTLHRVGTTERF
jgi:hypothetical protein